VDGGSPQCWPSPGSNCQTFTGCVPDSNTSCDANNPCTGDGQVCNTALGLCKAQVQVCPLGTTCDPSARICVLSCTLDQDCEAPKKCVNRSCQTVGACQQDTDCPTDKVCNNPTGPNGGECVPFCTTDSSCGPGFICQPYLEADGSYRPKCFDGCLSNANCPATQVCQDSNGNLFVATDGGTTFGSCQGTYNGGQACQDTLACGSCQFCGTGNTCQSATSLGYCTTCDPNNATSCSSYGAGSQCLSLAGLDGQGNVIASGPYYCGVPCTLGVTQSYDQSSCPSGFICSPVQGQGTNLCVPANYNCQELSGAAKCQ
jgi:hypothetical protein